MALDFTNSNSLRVADMPRIGCEHNRSKQLLVVALLLLISVTAADAAQQASSKSAWLVKKTNKTDIPKTDDSALEDIDSGALDADAKPEAMASAELEANTEPEVKVEDFVETSPIKSVVLLEPELGAALALRQTLDLQFDQIQSLAETEDSFNQRFGELYSAYARTLLKVGRLTDARKMFANALHNIKINNGVNSLQQRPVLRELFEMGLATGNVNDAEKQLRRLLWIEKGNPEDSYSFDLVMKLGNFYLGKYLVSKRPTEKSLIGLNKSIHYFGYALRRYNAALITSRSLPYGDFAYAHYLKRLVRSEVDFELYIMARERSVTDLDAVDSRRLINNGFAESNHFLRLAYTEAKKSLDFEGSVRALLSIGDLYLLYGNAADANTYYQLARKNTVHLPLAHPLIKNLDAPQKLPAFKLSIQRDPHAGEHAYQAIPMQLDIDTAGYVGKVTREPQLDLTMAMRIRAKQTAKRLRFRPIIEDGQLKPIKNHQYNVQVPVRALTTLVSKQTEK